MPDVPDLPDGPDERLDEDREENTVNVADTEAEPDLEASSDNPDPSEADAPDSDETEAGPRFSRWAVAALVLLVVVAGASTWWFTTQRDGLPEGAVLEVGDRVVSVDDFRDRQAAYKAMYGIEAPTGSDESAQFRRDAAKSIAVGLVLEDAARERGVTVASTNVDATLGSYVETFFGTGEEGTARYLDALGQAGASEDDVRVEISRQLLVARLFQDVTAGVEPATDDEVRAAFDDRRCDLQTPEQREIRNIVVPTEKEATAIRKGIDRGVPFTRLALKRSIDQATRAKGGSLGVLTAEDLEADYAAEAFSVEAGDYFGPVKGQYGWNVGQVRTVVPPAQATYDDTRAPLAELLLDERRSDAWRSWLEEQLVAADVTYADDYRPQDPTAAPALDTQAGDPGAAGESAAACGGDS